MAPAPRTRVPKGTVVADAPDNTGKAEEQLINVDQGKEEPRHNVVRKKASQDKSSWNKTNGSELSSSPRATFLTRRISGSSGVNEGGPVPRRSDSSDIMEHLKHLGPSNLASRPRTTRYNTVKIKPGVPKIPENAVKDFSSEPRAIAGAGNTVSGIGEGLVGSAGKGAKDGVHALQVGYGSIDRPRSSRSTKANEDQEGIGKNASKEATSSSGSSSATSSRSTSTIGSLPERDENRPRRTRTARSGSITENVIETGGIKKVVLETNGGSDEGPQEVVVQTEGSNQADNKASKKKRRRKRKKDGQDGQNESTPLLSG